MVQQMFTWQGNITGILTENGDKNDDSGDRGVGGGHEGVSVVVVGRSSVGGAIQPLEVGD